MLFSANPLISACKDEVYESHRLWIVLAFAVLLLSGIDVNLLYRWLQSQILSVNSILCWPHAGTETALYLHVYQLKLCYYLFSATRWFAFIWNRCPSFISLTAITKYSRLIQFFADLTRSFWGQLRTGSAVESSMARTSLLVSEQSPARNAMRSVGTMFVCLLLLQCILIY